MFPEVTVLRKRIIQLLVFSFPFQIPRNFKFLFAQTIVFDLGAIWNFPTICYQAFIFRTSTPKITWIFFRSNVFSFDKKFIIFRHPITNQRFVFPVII